MYIKSIKSEQFAGVRRLDKNFDVGLNVVFGNNEAGKSTLVDILSETLFCKEKYRKNGDEYKDFFPAEEKDSIKADNIDGTVIIATDSGEATISKKWNEKNLTAKFVDEAGRNFEDVNNISEKRNQIFKYEKGVYSEILFSSQKNVNNNLQKILENSISKEKSESIPDILAKLSQELGGISVDKIEDKINEKLKNIIGDKKIWNDDFSEATKNKGQKWQKEITESVKAYYNLEDARNDLDALKRHEQKLFESEDNLALKKKSYKDAKNDCKAFAEIRPKIENQNTIRDTIKELKQKFKDNKDKIDNYPNVESALRKAKDLKDELRSSKLAELSEAYKNTKTSCPTDEEVKEAKSLERRISEAQNKLMGININAAVQMLGGNTIEVRSVSTGKQLELDNGKISITEAVNLIIPGVAEIQLSAANTDVVLQKSIIDECSKQYNLIFEKYNVKSMSELETRCSNHAKAINNFENLKKDFARDFDDYNFYDL